MNTISKSLQALDDFINNVSREDKEKIWREVKELNIQGPTVYEYFSNLFYEPIVRYKFEEGIQVTGNYEPPQNAYKISIQPSEFPLEAFLYN